MQCCLAYMHWYALWPVWFAEVCQHMEWITCFDGSLTHKLGMLKHKQSLSPQDNYQIAWNSQTWSNTLKYSSTYIYIYIYIYIYNYIYITVIKYIIKNTILLTKYSPFHHSITIPQRFTSRRPLSPSPGGIVEEASLLRGPLTASPEAIADRCLVRRPGNGHRRRWKCWWMVDS